MYGEKIVDCLVKGESVLEQSLGIEERQLATDSLYSAFHRTESQIHGFYLPCLLIKKTQAFSAQMKIVTGIPVQN